MKQWIDSLVLEGKYVRLEPLGQIHCHQLMEAVQDGELWNLWYTRIAKPEDMSAEIERRINLQKRGEMVPFTIINKQTNLAVGMTTYCRLDEENRRLEIGYTWYRKSCQRTAMNTESKLLLLKYAFEKLHCLTVEFRTNGFNLTSQKAIARLGAKLDGILRNARVMPNGIVTDAYIYSIIAHEWPAVKANLEFRLGCHS